MSTRNLCLFACLAALMLAGCPEPLVPPTAVISVLDPSAPVVPDGGVAGACTPITAAIDGKIGLAAAVTGACSTDPQALGLSYAWSLREQPLGGHATIHDPSAIVPAFAPDVPGDYRLRLVVSNGTLTSAPADIVISVSDCGVNAPVVASISAEPSATVSTGQAVRLSPMVTDADTDAACAAHADVFSYAWRFEDLPVGSAAALNDPTAIHPSFTPDVPGTYVARVTVTDPTGRTATDTISITVGVCGSNAPVIESISAEPSATVSTGQAVRLTPTFSDADTETGCAAHAPVFTFAWRFEELPAGSAATLNDTTAIRPSFTADVPGAYIVRVTVTDPTGRSATDITTVTVGVCRSNAPTATAGTSTPSVSPGAGVQLQGTADDADNAAPCSAGQSFTYAWRLSRVPAGSIAVLNDPSSDWPSFVADMPGDYVAALVVTDSTGLSSPAATVTVTADTCGTARPVAAAQKLNPGTTELCGAASIPVNLAGGGGGGINRVHLSAANSSDADNAAAPGCGLTQTLFYRWTVLSAPWDGRWTLSSADGLTTDLQAQNNGEYRVRLLVTDSTGRTSNETTCTFAVTGF